MRPIVVFMEEDKREALRGSGGFPDAWFTSFDDVGFLKAPDAGRPAVLFWPNKINYDSPPELTDSESPFDLITYLGGNAAAEQAEKQLHKRMVNSAFCNTIAVHVIFLEAEKEGDVSKYLHLRTFGDLARWGRDFKKAVDRNLNNRTNASHVLVVVVSGEEVKTSTKELDDLKKGLNDFSLMIKDSGFSRCYILNHDLGRGDKGMNYNANDVWRSMLERLLLHFILSEEQGVGLDDNLQERIFIWQAFECRMPFSFVSSSEESVNRTAEIADEILDEDLRERLQFAALPKRPDEFGKGDRAQYEKLKLLSSGWAGYDVRKLVESCRARQKVDSGSCGTIRQSAIAIGELIAKCRFELSDWLLGEVHEAPAVKKQLKEIKTVLDNEKNAARAKIGDVNDSKGGGKNDSGRSISETVTSILEHERERQDALRSLLLHEVDSQGNVSCTEESLAEAVRKAQRHYVGLLKGALYFGAVAIMAGWVIWRVVMVLGGTAFAAMIFSLSFAVGGFGMLLIMLSLQRIAGDRAVRRLLEDAEKSDEAMRAKENAARKLQFYARARHCHLVRIGMLASLRQQLDRAYKVLARELKKRPDEGRVVEGEGDEDHGDLARRFDEVTVTRLAEIPVKISEEDWKGNFKKEIKKRWKNWCKGDKVEIGGKVFSNGYFPVASLYRVICNFMVEVSYLVDFPKELKRDALKENKVLDLLEEWCSLRNNVISSEFASADVKDVVMWPRTKRYFYIPKDPQLNEHPAVDNWKCKIESKLEGIRDNVEEKCEVFSSSIIDECRTFALFYRELAVHLDIDDRGVLVLRRTDEEV